MLDKTTSARFSFGFLWHVRGFSKHMWCWLDTLVRTKRCKHTIHISFSISPFIFYEFTEWTISALDLRRFVLENPEVGWDELVCGISHLQPTWRLFLHVTPGNVLLSRKTPGLFPSLHNSFSPRYIIKDQRICQ